MQKWSNKTRWIPIELKPNFRVFPVAPHFVFCVPFLEFNKELPNEFILVSAQREPQKKVLEVPLEPGSVLTKASFNVETLILTCEVGVKGTSKTTIRYYLLDASILDFAELVPLERPDDEIRNPQKGDNWGCLDTDNARKAYKDLTTKLRLGPNNHLYYHKDFVFCPSNSSEDGFSRMQLFQNDKLVMQVDEPSIPGLAIIAVGNTHGMIFDWQEGYVKSAIWFVYFQSTLAFFGIE